MNVFGLTDEYCEDGILFTPLTNPYSEHCGHSFNLETYNYIFGNKTVICCPICKQHIYKNKLIKDIYFSNDSNSMYHKIVKKELNLHIDTCNNVYKFLQAMYYTKDLLLFFSQKNIIMKNHYINIIFDRSVFEHYILKNTTSAKIDLHSSKIFKYISNIVNKKNDTPDMLKIYIDSKNNNILYFTFIFKNEHENKSFDFSMLMLNHNILDIFRKPLNVTPEIMKTTCFYDKIIRYYCTNDEINSIKKLLGDTESIEVVQTTEAMFVTHKTEFYSFNLFIKSI